MALRVSLLLPVFASSVLFSEQTHAFSLPCGSILVPGEPGFANSTYIDNGRAGRLRQPALVAQAECTEDIPAAMAYAQRNGLAFTVKGGGHSAAGYSLAPNGITVDMSRMNASRVEYDPVTGAPLLWVQAGARFGQVYERLNKTGLILAGGGCSTVGVSGFTLGGGLSFLSRAYGLAIDNLVSLRMVAPNGTVLNISGDGSHQTDIWWALRGGGGGNFGVVVDLTLRLHAGEERTTVQEVCWRGSEAAIFALPKYAAWLEPGTTATGGADPRIGAPALLIRRRNSTSPALPTSPAPPPPPPPVDLCVTLFAIEGVNVSEQVESLVAFVNASQAPDIVTDGCAGPTATFYEWESRCGALKTGVDGDDGYMSSGVLLAGALDDGIVAERLVNGLATTPGERTIINFHDGGGAIRSPQDGGAFAHRNFNLIYQIKGIWVPDDTGIATKLNMEWGTKLQQSIAAHVSGAYLNYIDPLLSNWTTAYYGDYYDRLVRIKQSFDPANFFRFNQSIGATSETPAPTSNCASSEIVALMEAFQAAQNAKDAAGLAAMYSENGLNFIPADGGGAPTAIGRAAIEASYAAYFSTLASIKETVNGPMIVNGQTGAFAKTIETTPKATSTTQGGRASRPSAKVTVTHVVNWFEFDCSTTSPPLISTFHALFNSTA